LEIGREGFLRLAAYEGCCAYGEVSAEVIEEDWGERVFEAYQRSVLVPWNLKQIEVNIRSHFSITHRGIIL